MIKMILPFLFLIPFLDLYAQNNEVNDFSGMEMIYVKGGSFFMGCRSGQSDCKRDEKPAHKVELDNFYIAKYEVTQAEWVAVMGDNPSENKDCPKCPVENVSWYDVQEFITKLNVLTGKTYRLPTEAEWEYAAFGGNSSQQNKFAGSNNISDVAWNEENSGGKANPVGQKLPNELGLYDMSGNVREWCSDWYAADFYENSPAYKPNGPQSGSFRVIRGGAWNDDAQICRISARYYNGPVNYLDNCGFRLALNP